MGFDLYGKAPTVPRVNIKEINSIQKKIDKITNDKDLDTSERHEKIWAHEQAIDQLSPGTYFRNNIWWWRPLWMYTCDLCKDLLKEKDMTSGTFNDGHFISKAKAKRIAKRIRDANTSGDLDKYCTVYNQQQAELPKDDWRNGYPFSVANALEFATFCEASGGFAIY